MKPSLRSVTAAIAMAVAVVAVRADVPHIYAIKGARIVPVAGAAIPSGTIVIRNGVIEAVGASVDVPEGRAGDRRCRADRVPGADRHGKFRWCRPDAATAAGQPADDRGSGALEADADLPAGLRYRRSRSGAKPRSVTRYANAGITSVLALPGGSVVKGRSALVNVAGPVDEPPVGNVGDYRKGLQVVKTPVALHVEFPNGARGDGYPASLLGVISFVRQSFLDAQHQQSAPSALRAHRNRPPAGRTTIRRSTRCSRH